MNAKERPRPGKTISVLLAEDHAGYRKSLKVLVESDAGIEVVGEAADGRQAIKLAGMLHPTVIIMDIAMPLLNGLQATTQILKDLPATKILILSANTDPEYILHAAVSGASGYLFKQSSTPILIEAIREAHKGNSFFRPPISRSLCTESRKLFSQKSCLKGHL
jgi:DNA-binding NarL/FixJ family response regulator